MKFVNYASYLTAPGAPLEVGTAPYPSVDELGDDEIIVKSKAVAINPVDWKIQSPTTSFKIPYPFILGQDVAGEVLHTPAHSPFQKGDRVIGHALALSSGSIAYGGFQLYVKLKTATVARIPDSLSFENASVLPLSVSTAAAGLFMDAALGLPARYLDEGADAAKGTVLLWGGSSSVGSSVVQLAVAAGYRVVATASPANYGYVKSLGADLVLDYHNPDIVAILAGLLRGEKVVGVYDAIGSETTVRQSAGVLAAVGGGRVASVGTVVEDVGKGVEVVRIGATGIVTNEPHIGKKVWGEWLPDALEKGTLKAQPKATVVGSGLYYLEGALQLNKRGVSAAKVVVSL